MSFEIKEPNGEAVACVIWMHGLGADAQDMAGLAAGLRLDKPVRHVFLNAPVRPVTLNNHMPMRAWYDIIGFKLTDREDREGILQSVQTVADVIAQQKKEKFSSEQIFLAGFSQGGAIALVTGLMSQESLGGIVALSSYLPLSSECRPQQNIQIPMFIGNGLHDPVVMPAWTQISTEWLKKQGYQNIDTHQYPMEHAVCAEEMMDLSQWFNRQIASMQTDSGSIP